MEKEYTTEQYISALFSLYPPHHDNCGYASRLSQLGERLQELQRKYNKNEILPESGQGKIIQETMSFVVDCLRLSMFSENQCQDQQVHGVSQERRESTCLVLQQS